MSTTQLDYNNVQPSSLALLSPTISNIQVTDSNYNVLNDTAVNTLGGYIKITGSNFLSGAQVYIGTTLATSVSLVSSTVLNVQVPATAAGSYNVVVANTNGTYGLKPIGITFSPVDVTWVTGTTLQPFQTGTSVSIQLNATGAVGYQVQAGSSLPTGLSMTSGGLITGTVTVTSDTTYNFTIEAYDAELQDAPRTFSLTITLNPPNVPIDYLVVAGGGSGGTEGNNVGAGGGGAGGLLTGTALNATPGATYTVTVGGGGTAISGVQSVGNQGGNSSVSGTGISLTAVGGGAGGRGPNTAGNGGSGGGTAGGSGTVGKGVYPGSTYLSQARQGYDGALGVGTYGATQCSAGGGGGSSGAGGTGADSATAGPGGLGTSNSYSGSPVTYATGGNGGAYNTGAGTAGTPNTGNGGNGAGGQSNTGGGGGSGIVIIRYADTYSAASATTGSPTITVTGGYRIYKFTGSGSITF